MRATVSFDSQLIREVSFTEACPAAKNYMNTWGLRAGSGGILHSMSLMGF